MIKNIIIRENSYFEKTELNLKNKDNGEYFKNIIFIGENGCYKTKLIKAILVDASKADLNPLQQKILHELSADKLTNEFKKFISVEIEDNNLSPIYVDCKFDPTMPNKDKIKILESPTIDNLDAMYTNNEDNKYTNRTFTANNLQYIHTDYIFYKLYDEVGAQQKREAFKNNLSECRYNMNDNTFKKIIKHINDFTKYVYVDYANLYNNTKDLSIKRKINSRSDKPINLTNLSSGESQIFGIFGRVGEFDIANSTSAVLAIDEPETNLHPIWQTKILNSLSALLCNINNNNQIICATHSSYIIQDVLKDKNSIIISLNKDEKTGKIKIRIIENSDLILLDDLYISEINYKIFGVPSPEYYVLLYEKLYSMYRHRYNFDSYSDFDVHLINDNSLTELIQIDKANFQSKFSRFRHLIIHGLNNEEKYAEYILNPLVYNRATHDFYNLFKTDFFDLLNEMTIGIINLIKAFH